MDKMQEGKLHQEVSQSQKPKEVLDNPSFKEAFDKLRDLYSTSLLNTGTNETETREKLWLAYQVLGKVEQHFREIIDTGKLASKQLEDFRNSIEKQKF